MVALDSLHSLPSVNENGTYEDDDHYDDLVGQQPPHASTSTSDGMRRRDNRMALSKISKAYDAGNKGYLTDAERELRAMDIVNAGALNNAQVAQLMEQKLRSDEIIARLRHLLWFLGGMTVLLVLCNLGTAWAVAALARDSAVDVASGELRVVAGGGNAVVTTKSKGDTFAFSNAIPEGAEEGEDEDGDEEEDARFCITPTLAAQMWHESTSGTPVTAFLNFGKRPGPNTNSIADDSSVDLRALSLTSDGSIINGTHACIGTVGGADGSGEGLTHVCIDFVSGGCDNKPPRGAVGRSDEEDNAFAAAHDGATRRRLFHSALQELGHGVVNQPASNLRGVPLPPNRQLVPAPGHGKSVCEEKCQKNEESKKCKNCRRQERKNQDKKARKKQKKWMANKRQTVTIQMVDCDPNRCAVR